jgi:hypothetical protein
VNFVAITLCIASQRVFIFVSVYFVMTQSGNFWAHPRTVYLPVTFYKHQITVIFTLHSFYINPDLNLRTCWEAVTYEAVFTRKLIRTFERSNLDRYTDLIILTCFMR